MQNNHHPKITPVHLDRKAIIYIRQSSEKQVQDHLESRRLQYALRDRAAELGWREIESVDEDLGVSASLASVRTGFDRMIATVARAQVGIIFSLEASRLSRTDKDWCRLLELCGIFDTLIADGQNIYDLKLPDDQLMLGIKGALSVMELNMIRMRMTRGAQEKAKRGELRKTLPAGYVYDGTGKVVRDPDRRVRECIELVFRKYHEMPSVRQLYLWFHEEGIELPVNKFVAGKQCMEWQLPRMSYVREMLRNPVYAGCYAYGRRRTEFIWKDDHLVKRSGRYLPMDEWRVLIRDHHEGYIDWREYEAIEMKVRANALQLGAESAVGAARDGQGLLNGLMRCGRCGRKMHVRYWGKSGTAARYLCKGDFDSGGTYCLGFGGGLVDRRFGGELLKVIRPMTLEASIKAVEMGERERDEKRQVRMRQVEAAEYEAKRAFEQYNEVDPRNRLVAAELERRWNEKLHGVETLRGETETRAGAGPLLSEAEKTEILSLADRFGAVWESPACPVRLKKEMIRAIVEEVIANEAGADLRFIIHWKGGAHTEYTMPRPVSAANHKTAKQDLELIREMAARYGDDEIARVLNKLGRKTAKGNRWNSQRVKTGRRRNDIPDPDRSARGLDILSQAEAAAHCGVSTKTIRTLASRGILKYGQIAPHAPWEIQKTDLDAEPVRSICEHLKQTGALVLSGVCPDDQIALLPQNRDRDNGGYYE